MIEVLYVLYAYAVEGVTEKIQKDRCPSCQPELIVTLIKSKYLVCPSKYSLNKWDLTFTT